MINTEGGGGGAKSQFTYVGLNSSVTECSIKIILSGMITTTTGSRNLSNQNIFVLNFFKLRLIFAFI